MSTSIYCSSKVRRLAAAGAFSVVLTLGVGTAAAGEHSGGESPSEETRDPGATQTETAGVTVSRGGLPVTGSDIAGLAAAGVAAVAIGSGAIVVSKRRNHLST